MVNWENTVYNWHTHIHTHTKTTNQNIEIWLVYWYLQTAHINIHVLWLTDSDKMRYIYLKITSTSWIYYDGLMRRSSNLIHVQHTTRSTFSHVLLWLEFQLNPPQTGYIDPSLAIFRRPTSPPVSTSTSSGGLIKVLCCSIYVIIRCGTRFNIKTVFSAIGISIIKIKRSWDRVTLFWEFLLW